MKHQEALPDKPIRPNKRRRFLAWLVIAVVLVAIVFTVFRVTDPTCAALLLHSGGDIAIPLPANCKRISEVPADDMVSYLEKERDRRGLIFKEWITCDRTSQAHAAEFTVVNDPHWLPSYIPNTYQFRRTVIILPYGQDISQDSPVAAEVSLMPWRKYISQIMGECDGKFSVWK